jgi:nucleolin
MSADGARKLFVGGLADSATEEELRSVFEGAGFVVEHLALPRDRESGRLRGFAFITLTNEAEASRARSELQGADCSGRPLSIREFSQEPPKRGPGNERVGPRQPEPTVFLGKLPFDATQEEIQELFASEGVGPVIRVSLPLGPDGRPRGFGFATLADQEQVDLAVSRVNGASLKGRQIVVSPAQPRGAPTGGGPGGGGAPRGGSDGRPPRAGGGYAPRQSDRGGSDSGFDGGYRSFDGPVMDPPMFPPPAEGRGGGRRRHEPGGGAGAGRKEKREKRRGAGSTGGGEASVPSTSAGRGDGKRRRGGGANWHQWESDDD